MPRTSVDDSHGPASLVKPFSHLSTPSQNASFISLKAGLVEIQDGIAFPNPQRGRLVVERGPTG